MHLLSLILTNRRFALRGGVEAQGEVDAFLSNKAFILQKDPAYMEACLYIYDHKDELTDEFDVALAESLHRDFAKEKNITPEMQHERSLVYNRAYVNWREAKSKKDFSIFSKSLGEVRDVQIREANLHENRKATPYDTIFDGYERELTSQDLDDTFNECKERLVPLLKKIMSSKKKIRTDFLSRPVSDESQKACAQYLLDTMGFDFNRGAFATTEHPFTIEMGKNDTRVTTHYYPDAFYSSMFSIIHEGGHALFEQNQPAENYSHYIEFNKTMGMHESTSRFYENRIGRSREFIALIYPKCCELFPNVFEGVSEQEFYESMNTVTPSLIRTEADEFTYTFHIIIRYEIEKMIVNGSGCDIASLPKLWNEKYSEYLGITPAHDAEGILQDIHWTSGFGYFPTYALGNMYNAMYYNKMASEFDLKAAVRSGDFATINGWMKKNVWARADREAPKTWIKNITGRDFTPKDFLDYLEAKYGEIYGL
ncbi:carboxypeptidase M32 [Fibrobacter sp. UWEL]|uniref:carboxypeptidase M32 n=1 Tax=Fibrobacter sp. UWEL TaxID=1896209 RepID=UPI0009179B5D|nr:carboxypeptidase M32 [Fibrobacter sp. UWEL]SHK49034.1 carboxypeptidase Taq [Fibrobacter sp. UWEL]